MSDFKDYISPGTQLTISCNSENMESDELEPQTSKFTKFNDPGDSGDSDFNDNGSSIMSTDKEISWKTDEFHKVKGY